MTAIQGNTIQTDASHTTYTVKDKGRLIDGIHFQSKVIPKGIDGVTIEDLLLICLDRLNHFQKGRLYCAENQQAIVNIYSAICYLNMRTLDRKHNGTEGTYNR